jgi:hypothetical protein
MNLPMYADLLRRLNLFQELKNDRRSLPDLKSPFYIAREIGEVHEYFSEYNTATEPFLQSKGRLAGHCYICRKQVSFKVDRPRDGGQPNWRETLRCPRCKLINRWRSCLHLFDEICEPSEQDRIYITEALSLISKNLSSKYLNLTSSEYLPGRILGEVAQIYSKPVRNEDVTQLTFDDLSFEAVLCFDVLEHVPGYRMAISEFQRVLNLGGHLILTAPFSFQHDTRVRAKVDSEGKVEHLTEPDYHGAIMYEEGILSYYDFGMELLDELNEAGFSESFLVCYKSNEWGYPAENVAFVAKK